MVNLDHPFSSDKPTDYNWDAILDLDRVIPCVEGGSVVERTSPDSAKAEILVKMGAMSMKFVGTVAVAERDDATHTAVLKVKSRESGGQGYANADVRFTLRDGGGDVLVIAHGGTVRVIDAYLNGVTVDQMAWRPVDNATIVRIPEFGVRSRGGNR